MRRGKKRTVADESEKLGEKSQKISVCVEGGAGGGASTPKGFTCF